MEKDKIKEKIYWLELNRNGLQRLNGGDVKVRNIRINKTKNMVIANITLVKENWGDGDYYIKERFKDCEYPLQMLEKIKLNQ